MQCLSWQGHLQAGLIAQFAESVKVGFAPIGDTRPTEAASRGVALPGRCEPDASDLGPAGGSIELSLMLFY